jgi:hypothetical protein
MSALTNWLKTLFIGNAPEINVNYCSKGTVTSGLKSVITKDIELILNNRKGRNYKFGKTGYAPTRVDQDDYRAGTYDEMFLLYESTSEANVSTLEEYYATKYHSRKGNDNIHTHSGGKMRSLDGYYYLYMVI